MKNFEHTHSSIPEDIAIKIASSLELPDLCSLGCCSRYWRELCGSEFIWEFRSKKRWPRFSVDSNSRNPEIPLSSQGWREFYIKQHHELAIRTQPIVKFVEESLQSNSLEVNDYLKAIEEMSSIQLGFEDVQMLFFKPGLNVLLNLVGLHYCINYLQVPAAYVVEALGRCKISDRQVCVRWWKLGRWFYGFRMRDESHVRLICLADVATTKEENVLAVLQRGAIHETPSKLGILHLESELPSAKLMTVSDKESFGPLDKCEIMEKLKKMRPNHNYKPDLSSVLRGVFIWRLRRRLE